MIRNPGSSASCYGKKVYYSYWAAQRAARNLNKHREGTKANFYRCVICHFWHVGNTMGKMRKRRPSRHTEKGRQHGRV